MWRIPCDNQELKNYIHMKGKKMKVLGEVPTIKVKLDDRTTITVRTKAALKGWLERYPEAKVIS